MLFSSTLDSFQDRFVTGLQQMLTGDSLGAFILALANSMQDTTLRQRLAPDLQRTFARLSQQAHGDAPPDDQAAFAALLPLGCEALGVWEYLSVGQWEVVLNPLRALRPARASHAAFSTLQQAFAPDKFHFNKPFLRPEILWEGTWDGMALRVLYNKFPFTPWHTLVVPDPAANLPQYLNRTYHMRMMALATLGGENLPGFGIAYNSSGAYASVNHLHFQGFVRPTALPVEAAHWAHNGGTLPYPLACQRYADADIAWDKIASLHQANQPYNLLYRNGYCYVMPRRGQGSLPLPAWAAQGVGWHETCGVFNITDAATVSNLDDTALSDLLAAWA